MEKKVRIMELRGTYKGGGGPDKTILLSAAMHDQKRYFVLVTYLRDPLDKDFQIGQIAKEYGVRHYVEVWDRGRFDFRCIYDLIRLIRKYSIDLVHVHDEKTVFLGLVLKIFDPRIRLMHTAHGWITNNNSAKIKQKLQFMLLRFYPNHIAVSKATKEIMIKAGIPHRKIKVLHNAIDIEYWRKGEGITTIRRELSIPEDSFVIGIIGRLSAEKDLPTFIKAAGNIIRQHRKTNFLIVGDGKGRISDELKELIKKTGIEGKVILTGHRNDLRNIYGSLDLFVLTSVTEGLPNTVLEAMAMGVPVIATNVGGVPELIDKGTGILINVGDVGNLTKHAVEIMTNASERKRISDAARRRIEEQFSFTRRLKLIEDYYLKSI